MITAVDFEGDLVLEFLEGSSNSAFNLFILVSFDGRLLQVCLEES